LLSERLASLLHFLHPAAAPRVRAPGEGEVAVLCDDVVVLRSGAGGDELWEVDTSSKGSITALEVGGPKGAAQLVAVGHSGGKGQQSFVTLSVEVKSGSILEEEKTPSTVALAGSSRIADGWYAAVVDGSLHVIDAKQNKVHAYETAELLSGGKGDVVFEATPHAFHLLLHQGGASTVFAVDAEGKKRPTVSVVHKFAASEGGAQQVLTCARDGDSTRVTAVSMTTESGATAEILSLPGGSADTFTFTHPALAKNGDASHAVSLLTTKRDGSQAHRVLLTTADNALHMLEPGVSEPKWVREEGLASVVQVSILLAFPSTCVALSTENHLCGACSCHENEKAMPVVQAAFVDLTPVKGGMTEIPFSGLVEREASVCVQPCARCLPCLCLAGRSGLTPRRADGTTHTACVRVPMLVLVLVLVRQKSRVW
jgi:hypothetical protein